MRVDKDTVTQLVNKRISDVEDQVAENVRKPGGIILNADSRAAIGSTIPQPPFPFGAKSQKRLMSAADIVHYCMTVEYDLAVANMNYGKLISNFSDQWKGLLDQMKEPPPVFLKISIELPMMKWTDTFDYLSRNMEVRTILLIYVTRIFVDLPKPAPDIKANHSCGED
eukprot:7681516-Ditylum_brightwellii.AAC.1